MHPSNLKGLLTILQNMPNKLSHQDLIPDKDGLNTQITLRLKAIDVFNATSALCKLRSVPLQRKAQIVYSNHLLR